MARPHPIVGISAEFADRRGRGSYQAQVGILFHNEQQILIPTEKRFDKRLFRTLFRQCFLYDLIGQFVNLFLPLLLAHRITQKRQNPIRNILDATDKGNRHTRTRQLLFVIHRPKTVLQIVVFDAAEPLYRTVTAMVVGKDQSVG